MIRIASSSPGTKAIRYGLIGLAALGVFVALASAVMQLGLREWDRGYDPILMPQYLWLYPDDADVKKWAWRGGMGAGIVVFFALGAIFKRRVAVHGSARFASEAEIRRPVSGGDSLREPTGILLGQKDGRFLCLGGTEHVMLYAPTRSGKGVSCAIPNLLNWPDSAVVLDVKQENFARTAGFRAAHGQEVYLFDPLDPQGRTARYNPLGYIDRADATERLDELQKVATMLFPDPPKADPIWSQMARTGFIGVGCMVAETPDRPFTIGEIYRQLTIGDTKAYLRQTVEDRRATGSPLSERTVLALNDFTAAPDNMFGSTKNTITSSLALWLNPAVDRATSASDFNLGDVRERRITIYLGVSPDNMERVRALYALFFQQMIDLNIRKEAHRHKVLLVLDEFARLGQASVLASAFSFVASFGIRLLPILQSPSQLTACYGPDVADEIMTNCGVEIIFTPKELKVAQNVSERIGYHGVETKSMSRPTLFSAGRRSQTEGQQRRALMMPQEFLQMPRDELLIMRAGIPPVKGRKIAYYRHKGFRSRLLAPPEVPALGPAAPAADLRDARLLAATTENARLREELDRLAGELDASRTAPNTIAAAAVKGTAADAVTPAVAEAFAVHLGAPVEMGIDLENPDRPLSVESGEERDRNGVVASDHDGNGRPGQNLAGLRFDAGTVAGTVAQRGLDVSCVDAGDGAIVEQGAAEVEVPILDQGRVLLAGGSDGIRPERMTAAVMVPVGRPVTDAEDHRPKPLLGWEMVG